jgi:hypothetical protein
VQLLTKLPGRAALELLRQEVALKEPDRWLALALAEHVAADVAANQDAQLARELLEVAASLLGQDTDSIARVAAKGASIRLERNTVGMIIPLRTDDLRRRGHRGRLRARPRAGHPGRHHQAHRPGRSARGSRRSRSRWRCSTRTARP